MLQNSIIQRRLISLTCCFGFLWRQAPCQMQGGILWFWAQAWYLLQQNVNQESAPKGIFCNRMWIRNLPWQVYSATEYESRFWAESLLPQNCTICLQSLGWTNMLKRYVCREKQVCTWDDIKAKRFHISLTSFATLWIGFSLFGYLFLTSPLHIGQEWLQQQVGNKNWILTKYLHLCLCIKWEKLRSSQSSTWFLTETIFFCFSEAQSMRKRHHLHHHQIMVWNLLNHLIAMSIYQDCLGKIAFRYHTFWKSCSQDTSHVPLLLLLLYPLKEIFMTFVSGLCLCVSLSTLSKSKRGFARKIPDWILVSQSSRVHTYIRQEQRKKKTPAGRR